MFLGSHFGEKSGKNAIENSFKNRSRKNMENEAKTLPKWSRNRCPNSSKINAKSGNDIDQENNHVSLNGKIIEIHCKSKCF